jgi:hypothetical protein
MKSSAYTLAGWQELDGEPFPWEENERADDRMQRLGYDRVADFPVDGDDWLEHLTIWCNTEAPEPSLQADWPVIVEVNIGETCDEIVVSSWPALWRLLGELLPIVHRMGPGERVTSALERVLARAFHIWHGHSLDPQDVCHDCDPEEYRHLQAMRRQRERERAARNGKTTDRT